MADKIEVYLEEQRKLQRERFVNDPSAAFKLNVHFPTVSEIAKKLAPEDKILQLAADVHDYGRIPQIEMTGMFNDGYPGSCTHDHHVIGYHRFFADMYELLQEEYAARRQDLEQIASAILLHGLKGRAFEKEFLALDARTAGIVDTVSMIDDVANGTQCAGYLLRECEERAKAVSKGGFIPDENAELRTVTPRVMELFRQKVRFNRNAECETYPDYVLFGASLAIHSLEDPETRGIATEIMARPITV